MSDELEPTGALRGIRLNADGTDRDDWDDHWDKYGEAAVGNPANDYRRDLVLKLLGSPRPGAILLDIGSGQGQFAVAYQKDHPEVAVWGVEYSGLGVARGIRAAARAGVTAKFVKRDLLISTALDPDQPAATHAVCSEVLEHVEDPTTLMRNAISLLAPGARVVVTVPGGPRSAFDKHIGHFRHFTAPSLNRVLTDAGLDVEHIYRAGFPFFNLYKLAVVVRGQKLVNEIDSRAAGARPARLEAAVTTFFRHGFKVNRDDSRFGWQLAAVARVPLAKA
ncbi:MAG: Methyltransferase type 12 [Pseudonocardiales bacterium]|nr:Methyltransferase type 12 [Pseudonocardiales bacterium]